MGVGQQSGAGTTSEGKSVSGTQGNDCAWSRRATWGSPAPECLELAVIALFGILCGLLAPTPQHSQHAHSCNNLVQHVLRLEVSFSSQPGSGGREGGD